MIFVMSTPEHGECASSEGGCKVCAEYHGRALKVQEMWQEKAQWLNFPLSAMGHPVGQRGSVNGGGDRHVPRPGHHASGEARVYGRRERRACRRARRAVHTAARLPRPRESDPLRLPNPVRRRRCAVPFSATSSSSCPTLQRTSGRATTSAARSAWLSWQSTLAGGASVRPWGSCRRAASMQSAGSGSRSRASADIQRLVAALLRLGRPGSRRKRARKGRGGRGAPKQP